MDSLLPAEMAEKAEKVGLKKAGMDGVAMFVLALLAGAFISLGAMFATTAVAGAAGHAPYGMTRVLAGIVFSLGLILVVVGGAELFTGNNLLVMAWAGGKVSTRQVLRNWGIVYAGNFVGAVATAGLVYLAAQYQMGKGAVGEAALATAAAKSSLDFFPAVCSGILCNVLVCLAVWLTYSARTTADRIVAIIPPISAFVAAGFEHCVANMYFIPLGIFIHDGAPPEFWANIGKSPGDFSSLGWQNFLVNNLIPVTLGNVIGGAILVGAVYWFIYLRKREEPVAK